MSTKDSHAHALNPESDSSSHPSSSAQFYGGDLSLAGEVSRFIGSALGAGDAAVVIASKAHQDGLAQRLRARGLDITLAIEQGRYISLDAAETLARLLVNDWPDARRFAEVVGGAIEHAQTTMEGKQRHVAVFGEMVALLWAEGKHEAATRLEQLWNDLAKTHSFSLRHPSTLQKEAEESRLRLAAIVESSDDAIVSKDLNGIVTSWNGGAERMFGYKAEEIIGKPITLVIPPELQDDEPVILAKMMRGEKLDHFETVRLTKEGRRIDVSLTVSPLKDEEGRVIGAAKIVRDISEKKKIEQTLRLNERLASVGRLAATIAHEINNPLEAVTNLLFLAKRDIAQGGKARRHLEMADLELTRVAHITRQTLGFYRDNTFPTSVDICEIFDDLLFLYGRRLNARGIEVVKQYEGKIEISALAGEIRQVFSNLIANAIDAMPDGGSLIVRAANSHEWNNSNLSGVRVIVADTGAGIEPEHRKSLFQPFFTTKKEVGTGLGLWITRGIVEKHGGSIRVRSRTEAGRSGTAFSLFLPATPRLEEEAVAATLRSHVRDLDDSEKTSVA